MKKFLSCAGILLAVQMHSMNMDNLQKDGYPVIIPAVKNLVRTEEKFSLPETLAVSAPEGVDLGGLEQTFFRRFGGKAVRSNGGQLRFILTEENVPENKEAYTLEVGRSGVTVRARSLQGLHQGMQSLRWMIRNAEKRELKGCRITDFPDLAIRGVFLELNSLPPEKVDKLCEAIGIYSQLKYNTLLIDFGDNFPLKNNPYTLRKFTLSLSDIQKIQAACRKNHMEIIPFIQAITHAFWMTRHPEFEQKISEGKPSRPWASSYCLSKPLPKKLMEQYLADVTDILKPRYFHLAMDELDGCPFQVCEECRKHDPVELFGNHAKMLQDFLLARGVTPIIAHDQFDPEAPWWNSKVRDALKMFDRQVIVNIWDYAVHPNEKSHEYFNRMGFKVLHMSWSDRLENTRSLPRLAARTGSLGCILTWWLSLSPTLEWREGASVNSYAGTILGASDSWNASDEPLVRRMYDPVFEMKRLVEPDRIPDFGTRKAVEIPLDRTINTGLGRNPAFPRLDAPAVSALKKELAGTKERFRLIADQGNYFGIVLIGGEKDSSDRSVDIPVGRTVEDFSFLVTAAPFNDFRIPPNAKPVIGELKINFENGKSIPIPIQFRNTVNSWNAECGGYNTRIVNRGTDLRGAVYSFHALDWKNPQPAVRVKSITFSTKKKDGIAPGLFAVSAFGAGEGGIPAITDAEAVKNVPVSVPAKEEMNGRFLADFEPGRPRDLNYSGTSRDRFSSLPKFRVVDTPPNAPSKGKMLSILVPPLAEGHAWGRVTVDIPIESPGDFQTVLFDCRFSNPAWIWRSDLYLHNPGAGKADSLLNFNPVCVNNGFYSFAVPRAAFRGREGGGADFSGKLALRIGFFVTNRQPMTIDLDQIALSGKQLPWIRELRHETQK